MKLFYLIVPLLLIMMLMAGCGDDGKDDNGDKSAAETPDRPGLSNDGSCPVGVCNTGAEQSVPVATDVREMIEVGKAIKADPSKAAEVVSEVLAVGNPDAVKFKVLALGYSRTFEGRAALLRILTADTGDSRLKLLAAASAALTSNGRRILLPLMKGGVFVDIGAIDDEQIVQALAFEWQITDDIPSQKAYYEILQEAAGSSTVASDTLWDYVLDGSDSTETLARATELSRYLKANTETQTRLAAILLDPTQGSQIRYAAAAVLKDSSVDTSKEVAEKLLAAAAATETDALTGGYALQGMDPEVREAVDPLSLNTIFKDKGLPEDIRLAAKDEIIRKAKSGEIAKPE